MFASDEPLLNEGAREVLADIRAAAMHQDGYALHAALTAFKAEDPQFKARNAWTFS